MKHIPSFPDITSSKVFHAWDSAQGDLPSAQANKQEVSLIRDLAARVAALAERPQEKEKIALWTAHNRLDATRPLVFCDPEVGWGEIIRQEDLKTRDPFLREMEWRLRREIFWGEKLRDDYVIRQRYTVPLAHQGLDWGVLEIRHGGENGGAYIWDAPIKTEADIARLHSPRIGVDYAASMANLESAQAILGDILEVRLETSWWWTLGLSDLLAKYRGLEQMMFDLVEAPQIVDRIMGILRDGVLLLLDELERLNLLPANFDGKYVGSGGFGWSDQLPQSDFNGHVRTRDMWGFCESQETVSISPRMFNEHILAFQRPILERFGLNCYGCCEPLDKRWKYIREVPRLRRVSISAWADVALMASLLEDQFIFSWKPSPSPFAADFFDEAAIRKELARALELTRGCRLEIILKDVTTVSRQPQRVIRWVELVREEIERAGY